MSLPKVEVRPIEEVNPATKKVTVTYGLYINDWLLGTSKLDCDARLEMHKLNEYFDQAYWEGHAHGRAQ